MVIKWKTFFFQLKKLLRLFIFFYFLDILSGAEMKLFIYFFYLKNKEEQQTKKKNWEKIHHLFRYRENSIMCRRARMLF